ncbi:MAG: hypothetical protein JW742_01685 [Candidatus Aminicenantes bacterium]|nr:hypothetical protein [Candidatus Aminicenantes bacterium]
MAPGRTVAQGRRRISALILSACLGLVAAAAAGPGAAEQTLDEFLAGFQKAIEARDLDRYLEHYAPELRERERLTQDDFFGTFGMTSVKLLRIPQPAAPGPSVRVGFQALYQNDFSGMFETWLCDVVRDGDGWQIAAKTTAGVLQNLYRIQIPSDRVERVASVEVEHVDIKIAFENALVFYDNIPDLDTALLVIGTGRVQFTPSDPAERHQLELFYKRDRIADRIGFLFLRGSNQFFRDKVRILPAPAGRPVLKAELERAAALFTRYYPRSFTIENSMTGELFSFLPQGEEVALDMRGDRVGGLTYIYSPFGEDEVNVYDSDGSRIVSLYTPPAEDGRKRMFISFGERYDIVRTQVEVDLKPRSYFLSARARLELVPKVERLDVLKLKLNPALEILKIFDDAGRELFYTQDKLRQTLYVYLVDPPAKDVLTAVTVIYRGRLQPALQSVDVVAGPQMTDSIILSPISFDSVLYSQASGWYPAAPADDYFLGDLKVILPPDYKCVASGELKERGEISGLERVEDLDAVGSGVYRFVTRTPVKYLAFIAGRFLKGPETDDPLPIQTLFSSESRDFRTDVFSAARDIIGFFEERFGPFPYEKLGIVHRIWPAAGGHSPASFIVINEIPLPPGRVMFLNVESPVDLSRWKDYFLSHEIAHQWWGQNVTWGSYRDQWLSEGMAQFASILYLRKRHGEAAFHDILKKLSTWTERKSVFGPINLGSRLSILDFEAYQAVIYNKAALVMNMLLDLCGEDVLFGALREFQEKFQGRLARTFDLRRVIEARAGRDLGAFFAPWFSSHALPDVRTTRQVVETPDGTEVRVAVRQSGETFVFPLRIEWREGGRTRSETVVVDQPVQTFRFPVGAKPGRIVVNPHKAVPGRFRD